MYYGGRFQRSYEEKVQSHLISLIWPGTMYNENWLKVFVYTNFVSVPFD